MSQKTTTPREFCFSTSRCIQEMANPYEPKVRVECMEGHQSTGTSSPKLTQVQTKAKSQELKVRVEPIKDCDIEEDECEYMEVEYQAGVLDQIRTAREGMQAMHELADSVREVKMRVCEVLQCEEDEFVQVACARMESLIILLIDLSRRTTLGDMIWPMVQFVKACKPNEIVLVRVMKMLETIMCKDSDDQDEIVQQAGWFESNWTELTKGYFGKKLAGAISLLVMVGIMPKKCTSHIGEELFKVLHVQTVMRENSSILHHLFTTLDYIVDSVFPAIEQNDYTLLLRDKDFQNIDEMYRIVRKVVEAANHGRLKDVGEEHGIVDESSLLLYAEQTVAAHEFLSSRTQDKNIKKMVLDRCVVIEKIIVDLQSVWQNRDREKPWAALICGPTSVGKSRIVSLMTHTISRANGFPEGDEYRVTINADDEYQSSFRSQHLCVIFDDLCNTRPEREKKNPLFLIIQFINTMHSCALNPEADKKGKIAVRPKMVFATSNTRDLNAHHWSVSPGSVLRRFDVIIEVELKKECRDASGGIASRYASLPEPDIWELSLYKIHIKRNAQDKFRDEIQREPLFKQCNERGEAEMRPIGLVEFKDWLASTTEDFYAKQSEILESGTDYHLKEHCSIHPIFCLPCLKCADFGAGLISEQIEKQAKVHERFPEFKLPEFMSCMAPSGTGINDDFTFKALDAGVCEEETLMTPQQRISHLCGQSTARIGDLFGQIKKRFKKDKFMSVLGVIATIGIGAFGISRLMRPKMELQSAVLTKVAMRNASPQQLVERDGKYATVYSNIQSAPKAAVSSTLQQLEAKIDRNLHLILVREIQDGVVSNRELSGSAFPVGGTRWMTVAHYFEPGKRYEVEFRTTMEVGVKWFKAIITDANVVRCGNDVIVLDVPRGGDVTDMSKYMPLDADFEIPKNATLFVYHCYEPFVRGKLSPFSFPSEYKETAVMEEIVDVKVSGKLHTTIRSQCPNWKGLCGAMVFLAGDRLQLVGMHIAGNPKSKQAYAAPLHQGLIPEYQAGVVVRESAPALTAQLGKEFSLSNEVHAKSPVHYIPVEESVNFEMIGEHDQGTTKFRSSVRESPMADAVAEYCGVEKTHFPPPSVAASHSRRRHFMECVREKPPLDPDILKRASSDFQEKVSDFCANEGFANFAMPLTYEEALNGIPGMKGFDPINPKTSAGFMRPGPKYKMMVATALKDEAGVVVSSYKRRKKIVDAWGVEREIHEYEMEFDADICDVKQHTADAMEIWIEGQRENLIFKCNLKDEGISAAKVKKNKIRIFSGAPVHLVLAARMVTLSTLNLMTNFPMIFESAVGIDASGKDWQYLYDQFADCKGFKDGDFGSFDTTLPVELVKAAWDTARIPIAKMVETENMESEALKVFDGIATECMYPVYENNGLIYKAFASNPSGHPLTVVINGLAVSIAKRYVFFDLVGTDFPMRFSDLIRLMTYGDDNIDGKVQEHEIFEKLYTPEKEVMAFERIGMKYTSAEKDGPPQWKSSMQLISFISRGFHEHQHLRAIVAPLKKESIYKSLMLVRKSKHEDISVAEICAGNLSMALRELYLHSRQDYAWHFPVFERIANETTDSCGFRVADFFRPPTIEQIHRDYEATTCKFELANRRWSMMHVRRSSKTFTYMPGINPNPTFVTTEGSRRKKTVPYDKKKHGEVEFQAGVHIRFPVASVFVDWLDACRIDECGHGVQPHENCFYTVDPPQNRQEILSWIRLSHQGLVNWDCRPFMLGQVLNAVWTRENRALITARKHRAIQLLFSTVGSNVMCNSGDVRAFVLVRRLQLPGIVNLEWNVAGLICAFAVGEVRGFADMAGVYIEKNDSDDSLDQYKVEWVFYGLPARW